MGKCALCKEEKELQLSHIIPKFVGKYLKETSVGNIRNQNEPNKTVQDIEKQYLLCHDCEELFSASERYFANTIFYPYFRNKTDSFQYTEQLYYFITSLSWRSLYLDINDPSAKTSFKGEKLRIMEAAETTMHDYLIGKRSDLKEIEHHIFFFDRIESVSSDKQSEYQNGRPHLTIHRGLQSYSAYADNTIFTISNLMGIVIVTLYSKDINELWLNTQIYNNSGVIEAKNQNIASRVGGEFQYWMEQANSAQEMVSEKTKIKITEKLKSKGEEIKNYAMFKDFIDDNNLGSH